MASLDALRICSSMSPSRVEMWINGCQQKWAFIYVEGKKRPPDAARAFGNAWDRFISDSGEGFWTQKKRDGRSLGPGAATELFDHFFKEETEPLEDKTKPEVANELNTLQSCGVQGSGMWLQNVGDTHYPIGLQHKFEFTVGQGAFSLNGVLDSTLVRNVPLPGESEKDLDERPVIHDDKTAGQSWVTKTGPNAGKPTKKATASLQPLAYSIAAETLPDKFGKDCRLDVFVFDVLVKTKTPQQQSIAVSIDAKMRKSYLQMVANVRQQMIHAIDSGYFAPNRASNMCSRRWCPYADECIAIHGGEVHD